jgi:hypothetical protein
MGIMKIILEVFEQTKMAYRNAIPFVIEVKIMANMTWTPDENRDKKVKQYLDKVNHAPYGAIVILSMVLFCLLTALVLFGTF